MLYLKDGKGFGNIVINAGIQTYFSVFFSHGVGSDGNDIWLVEKIFTNIKWLLKYPSVAFVCPLGLIDTVLFPRRQ